MMGELACVLSVNFENHFRVVCRFQSDTSVPASRRRFPRLVAHAQLEMEIFDTAVLRTDVYGTKVFLRLPENWSL